MKNRYKILASVCATLGVTYSVLTRILFNVAFKPKSRWYNLFFSSKNLFLRKKPMDTSAYDHQIREGRKWMLSHAGQEVMVLSDDDLKLKAHFIETPKAKRTLVMAHGWHSDWDIDFAPAAKWLYEHGCNLLIIEQRAQGTSEGRHCTLGIKESRDILNWIGWLEDNEHIDKPVYLYGISMGAASVLMAAGHQMPFYVKGVIADCGFTSAYDELSHFCNDVLFIPSQALVPAISLIARLKLKINLKKDSTVEAMKTCEIPVLFIHGTADNFVPARMTMAAYNACQSPKRLVLIKGATHAMSFVADPKTYTRAVFSFFKSYC